MQPTTNRIPGPIPLSCWATHIFLWRRMFLAGISPLQPGDILHKSTVSHTKTASKKLASTTQTSSNHKSLQLWPIKAAHSVRAPVDPFQMWSLETPNKSHRLIDTICKYSMSRPVENKKEKHLDWGGNLTKETSLSIDRTPMLNSIVEIIPQPSMRVIIHLFSAINTRGQ